MVPRLGDSSTYWRHPRRNAADDRASNRLIDNARSALPEAGWWIRSSSNASPQLERTINRFTQFLTLVGLAALLVGGVGVANAVKSHIDRRRDVIASFKALTEGEYDHLPEQAFFLCGGVEDVEKNAAKLAG